MYDGKLHKRKNEVKKAHDRNHNQPSVVSMVQNSIWYPFYHSWVRAYFIVIATVPLTVQLNRQSISFMIVDIFERITIEASNLFLLLFKMITLSSTKQKHIIECMKLQTGNFSNRHNVAISHRFPSMRFGLGLIPTIAQRWFNALADIISFVCVLKPFFL